MTDYKSIIESPFYEKANKYVEETGNNDCTLEAYIDGATEATKELEAQIEQMKLCANCKHCGVSGWCDKLNRYLLDKANQCCGNWEIKD